MATGAKVDLSWLYELRKVRSAYRHATPAKRRTTRLRALRFAALTIHTPWIETFRRWQAQVRLPAGVLYRGKRTAPVSACVQAWHLDAFLDQTGEEDPVKVR